MRDPLVPLNKEETAHLIIGILAIILYVCVVLGPIILTLAG